MNVNSYSQNILSQNKSTNFGNKIPYRTQTVARAQDKFVRKMVKKYNLPVIPEFNTALVIFFNKGCFGKTTVSAETFHKLSKTV